MTRDQRDGKGCLCGHWSGDYNTPQYYVAPPERGGVAGPVISQPEPLGTCDGGCGRYHYTPHAKNPLCQNWKPCVAPKLQPEPQPTELREPTESDLHNPLWNAIWEVIKSWDIKTPRDSGDHGATGTDVCNIFDAVARAQGGELPRMTCDHCKQDVSAPEFAGHRTTYCHKPSCVEAERKGGELQARLREAGSKFIAHLEHLWPNLEMEGWDQETVRSCFEEIVIKPVERQLAEGNAAPSRPDKP